MRGPGSLVISIPGAEPSEAPRCRGRGGLVNSRELGGPDVLKKLLIVAGIVTVAAVVVRKVKASSDERALWHEATTAPDLR